MTPYETLRQKKTMGCIPFGYLVFYLDTDPEYQTARRKLDPCGRQSVVIGYAS